jgi:hypothetical protein
MNRTHKTLVRVNQGQDDRANMFDVSQRGARLLQVERDEGSDIEVESDEEAEDMDLDLRLTKIYRQFLLDITNKAPNQKAAGAESHVRMSKEDRQRVTEYTYMDRNLASYFHDCQWRVAAKGEWARIFGLLFPPKDYIQAGRKLQNYLQCTYFQDWEKLKRQLDDDSYQRVYRQLQQRFFQLYWMPYAQTDRIWYSRYMPKFNKSSGLPREKPAPLILVNGAAPQWFVR